MESHLLENELLHASLFAIEQNLYYLQQWFNSILRTVVCHLPPNHNDILPNAHKQCRFSQWYYKNAPQQLRKNPNFIALGKKHMEMHKAATRLLIESQTGKTIPTLDYDNFSNTLESMRLQLCALQKELSESLYHYDALTGAINRITMFPILKEQQEIIKRHTSDCTLVMMDLDQFKNINDERGHPCGDHVLATTSHFIIERLRPYDKLFRTGGEEFLICLQNTNLKLAEEIIERLRIQLAEYAIHVSENETIYVTASFGLEKMTPEIPIDLTIAKADKALYEAKARGGNCCVVWNKKIGN